MGFIASTVQVESVNEEVGDQWYHELQHTKSRDFSPWLSGLDLHTACLII